MMSDESGGRHSKAESAVLVADEDERARVEARNALKQFDLVLRIINDFVASSEKPFRLRPSTIQGLHREALAGLSNFAGNWRPAGVEIGKSKHTPPPAHLVAELVEDMCDYVNQNWRAKSPVHLASYIMWRLNWIHPFDDGNGRTSRAVSYLVLCIRSGMLLPGRNTIPEQIAANKEPYYQALEAADEADRNRQLDVSNLETLMSDYLAAQLLDVFNSATNQSASDAPQARILH
jgi:Fic family protein